MRNSKGDRAEAAPGKLSDRLDRIVERTGQSLTHRGDRRPDATHPCFAIAPSKYL